MLFLIEKTTYFFLGNCIVIYISYQHVLFIYFVGVFLYKFIKKIYILDICEIGMQIKRVISLIPFFVFSIIMISYFYNGFINPIETDYWIVRFGIPIIFFELCSLFCIIFLLSITGEGKSFNWPIFLLTFLMPVSFCFIISIFYNLLFFLYFLLSIFLKYIGFRKSKDLNDFPVLTINSLSWLFSMMIAAFFGTIVSNAYKSQNDLIINNIVSNIPASVENTITGGFIVLFGISYFTFQIVFTLIYEIFFNKK